MRKALESWTNPRGETVVRHEHGLAVLPPGQTVAAWEMTAQHTTRPTPRAVGAATLADVTRQVERLHAAVDTLAEAEIRTELARHPGTVAVRDTETGHVRTFLLPVDPATLPPREVERLQAEAIELRTIVDNPGTPFVERQRAETRLRDLEQRLHLDRQTRQPWMRPEVHDR